MSHDRLARANVAGSGSGSPSGRAGFPPRGQLPAGVSLERVPVLGTTWYDRGAAYWVRRFWLFLLMALVVTLTSLLVGGFLAGINSSSQTGFAVALAIEIVWSLVIIVYGMVNTARRWDDLGSASPLARRPRQVGRAGSVLGTLARAGLLFGQLVLVLGSLVFFGLYVMLLIYTLLPEYPPEHKARLRLAQRLSPPGR